MRRGGLIVKALHGGGGLEEELVVGGADKWAGESPKGSPRCVKPGSCSGK
jgi:hypothetical protein